MELIYVKDVDKSLLFQGFTIKTSLLKNFLEIFGNLEIGEVRHISIMLNGNIYSEIKVINRICNQLLLNILQVISQKYGHNL